MSWQHLTFVTCLIIVMVFFAVFFGSRHRNYAPKVKKRVLVVAALLIDGFELFKIVLLCFRSNNPLGWLYDLPLFLCSIQLITIPLAAFAKGRVQKAAMDFIAIFGIVGAVLGTYGAGNNYGSYPVLCFDNVVSGITHCISGFTSLYLLISRTAELKKRNIGITFGILIGFCVAAFIANHLLDYNYMFLMRGDGTPYDILYNLVNGHPVLYPMGVVGMFFVYIIAFYHIHYCLKKKRTQRQTV